MRKQRQKENLNDEDSDGVQWAEDDDGDENDDEDMLRSVFSKDSGKIGRNNLENHEPNKIHNNIEKEVDILFDQLKKDSNGASAVPYDPEYASLPGSRHRERRRKRREQQLLQQQNNPQRQQNRKDPTSKRSSFSRNHSNKKRLRSSRNNSLHDPQELITTSSATLKRSEAEDHSPLFDDLLEELVPTQPKKDENKTDKNKTQQQSCLSNNNKNNDLIQKNESDVTTDTKAKDDSSPTTQNDPIQNINQDQVSDENKNEDVEEDFDNGINWNAVDFDKIDNSIHETATLQRESTDKRESIINGVPSDKIKKFSSQEKPMNENIANKSVKEYAAQKSQNDHRNNISYGDSIKGHNFNKSLQVEESNGPPAIHSDKPTHTKNGIVETDFENGIQWDDVDFEMIEQQAKDTLAVPVKNAHVPSKEEKDEDAFGDFPDIDIEQFDNIVSSAVATSTNGDSVDDDDSGPFSFTPYTILDVSVDALTYTKTLNVTNENHKESNNINLILRDEWFFMSCEKGDLLHLVSRRGQSFTVTSVQELILDSSPNSDLWIILHPHMWLTPTLIAETIGCPRRAVLSNRCPSPTSTLNLSALAGSMKHELFQACLREKNVSVKFCQEVIQKLVNTIFTKQILALPKLPTPKELIEPLHQTIPQIQIFYQTFVQQCTNHLDGFYPQNKLPNFRLEHIHGIEESIVSPELGLKGNLDMTIVRGGKHFMPIELKTGHLQSTQQTHLAQLSLYTLLLKSRYSYTSATEDENNGMLLYLNDKSYRAINIQPTSPELASLLGQRNNLAYSIQKSKQSAKGKLLQYEQDYIQSEEEAKNCTSSGKSDNNSETDCLVTLPELIPYSRKCDYCFSNRECMLYRAASSSSDDNDNFKKLQQHFTGHLHKMDLKYFVHWDTWIDLEEQSKKPSKWWLTFENDESNKYIPYLTIDSNFHHHASSGNNHKDTNDKTTTLIKFNRSKTISSNSSSNKLSFERGSYWILSLNGNLRKINDQSLRGNRLRWVNLLRGFLEDFDDTSIYLRTNIKDWQNLQSFILYLDQFQDKPILFRLDKNEVSSSGSSILRHNLIQFMTGDVTLPFSSSNNGNEKKPQSDESLIKQRRIKLLRQLVVYYRKPSFEQSRIKSMFRTSSPSCLGCHIPDLVKEYSKLNIDQRNAVSKVVCANEYALIQGLPGTGKTSTITFLTRLLVATGKRVLITSYTHSAVDNILLKLKAFGMRNDSLLRIGQQSSTHSGVHDLLFPNIDDLQQSAWDLQKMMSSSRVVGVTALTIPKTPYINGQHFDVVIVDEAGQINQPAILGAIIAADRFVLVGDHEQLPPIVESSLPEERGYGISMLRRLAEKHPSAVAKLTIQYRMHEEICALANLIVYNGELKTHEDENIRQQQLHLKNLPNYGWIGTSKILHPDDAVLFINTDLIGFNEVSTGDVKKRHRKPITNLVEVQIVSNLVNSLLSCSLDAKSLGIISPFRSQVQLLCNDPELAKAIQAGVETSTIDKYQGRDKEVVILSFVRSNKAGKCGRLLQDYRRLNVAVSRAKKKLIMVGSFKTLRSGSQYLATILDHLQRKGLVKDIPKDFIRQNLAKDFVSST